MDNKTLLKEMEGRLGRVPAFFRPVLDQPDQLASLWTQVKSLYLDNPAPPLLKEKILARLARYCPSPYCLASHSTALRSLGMTATALWEFLKKPAPSLADEAGPAETTTSAEWPVPGSPAETRLLELSEMVFLHPGGSSEVRTELKKLAGDANFGYLWSLVTFSKICHFWLDYHREITVEEDGPLKERVAALGDEEPMLADFLRNYGDIVQRDRQALEDRLLNEIAHRRQMQEELTRYAAEMEESRDRMQEQASQMTKLAEELLKKREEMLVEINERKKVEESNRVYAEIVRNMPIGLNVWRLETPGDPRSFRLIATNPAVKKFTGADLEKSLGKNMVEVFPYLSEIPNLYAQVIEDGKPKELGESAYGEKDGPEGFFSIRVFPLPNRCVGVSYEDITERKQAEVELSGARDAALELARTRSEFLANMSHEIRTPLNAMVGMTNLLMESPLTDEQREMAGTASRSGDALLGIVNDILDFSKIESGKMTLETVDFDLRSAVDGALEILQARAQAKGLVLSGMYDEGVPTSLRGDPTRLRQILINLVANAVKFTEKGEVVVRASLVRNTSERAEVRLAVSDTGIGIPPESLRRLFQAFTQADTSTTRKYGGTGLGLAISKRLVELMGGEIGVESEVGSGSTFWCRIPFERTRESAAPAAKDRLAGTLVLIVDANASNRQILQHHALSWKMKVDAMADSSKALDLLRKNAQSGNPYRLLLLDTAAGSEALEFALKIKADPSLTGLRVVTVTPSGKPLDAEVRRAAGILASVTKPVREGALFDALLSALSGGPRSPSSSTEASPAEKRYFRLLLVEDNPVNQRVAQLQLGKLGYSADVAGSGTEALKAFGERTYDLIFMDCHMPDMDGFEATAEIRKLEGGDRRTPVVAMTADALEGDREKCLAAGMDDYLSKPVDMKKLGEILRRWDVTLDPSVLEGLRVLAEGKTELVRDVVNQYLKDAPKRLETIVRAAGNKDAKELERAAHALKGASGNIGARAMWAVCERVEELAREKTLDKAEAPVKAVEGEFEKLKKELERELEK